jgi:hypothetical protein
MPDACAWCMRRAGKSRVAGRATLVSGAAGCAVLGTCCHEMPMAGFVGMSVHLDVWQRFIGACCCWIYGFSCGTAVAEVQELIARHAGALCWQRFKANSLPRAAKQ